MAPQTKEALSQAALFNQGHITLLSLVSRQSRVKDTRILGFPLVCRTLTILLPLSLVLRSLRESENQLAILPLAKDIPFQHNKRQFQVSHP